MRPVTCELRGTACDLHAARCDLRPATLPEAELENAGNELPRQAAKRRGCLRLDPLGREHLRVQLAAMSGARACKRAVSRRSVLCFFIVCVYVYTFLHAFISECLWCRPNTFQNSTECCLFFSECLWSFPRTFSNSTECCPFFSEYESIPSTTPECESRVLIPSTTPE